jgi:hypothetical protein
VIGSAATAPTEAEVLDYFEKLSNWGRWGADDQLGTLNLITADHRRRGAALVREGESWSCAWDITTERQPGDFDPPERKMFGPGPAQPNPERRMSGSLERLSLTFHGSVMTHLDALSHVHWDARMYNGRPASLVTMNGGATWNSVLPVKPGVVTRGVLLDVAAARGVPWFEPGEAFHPTDLIAAEQRQGVLVGDRDALLVRTGYGRRKREVPTDPDIDGPIIDGNPTKGMPGPQVACAAFARQRGVAIWASDTGNDVMPNGYPPAMNHAFHAVAQSALGLWLIDNCDLEAVTERAAELQRWEFQFVLSALPVVGGTGSPVNPLVIF